MFSRITKPANETILGDLDPIVRKVAGVYRKKKTGGFEFNLGFEKKI